MNTNLQKRINSVFAWCGVFASAFMAVGYDWHNFTSWSALLDTLYNILKNPAMLVAFVFTIIAVFNNPTNKNGF